MARTSTLQIPAGAYHLRLFLHHVELFGGDTCCAAIISALDYLAKGRLEQMEAAGEPVGLLWVSVSMERLAGHLTCGMYSMRRVQDRLDFLSANRFIIMPTDQSLFGRHLSKPLTFLLNHEQINAAVKAGSVYAYEDGKTYPELQLPTNVSVPTIVGKVPTKSYFLSAERGVLNLKEEEENKNQEEVLPLPPFSPSPPLEGVSFPLSLSADQCAEIEVSFPSPVPLAPPVDNPDENVYDNVLMQTDWDFQSMVKFVRSRLKRVPRVKISNPDIQQAVASLQGHSQGHIEESLEAFCQESYWREYRSKGAALVKFVKEYSTEQRKTSSREAETGQGAFSDTRKVSGDPPSAPEASQGVSMPNRVLEWNAAMPESVQVKHWNGNAPKQELAEAEFDPEFGETFAAACAACREIIETGKMKGVYFDWLFRKSKGKPNWYQVTHGLFSFAMKESTNGAYNRESPPSEIEAIALAMFASPVPK